MDQEGTHGLWELGDLTETFASFILLAVLVGILLILIALFKRSCCPDDVAGSYVSVAVEAGNIEEAGETSGDAGVDPVRKAAANWVGAPPHSLAQTQTAASPLTLD